MSRPPDPAHEDAPPCDEIEHINVPRRGDEAAGRSMLRLLPSTARQKVGPFVHLEQIGPVELPARTAAGIELPTQSQIGQIDLTAITYLFDGRLRFTDSLGAAVVLAPGGATFLTAERGDGLGGVQCEHDADEAIARRLFGVQVWAALPISHEAEAAKFSHFGVDELPRSVGDGTRIRLIVGSLFDKISPVEFPQPAILAEAMLAPGAILPLEDDWDDRAVFIVSGAIDIAGHSFSAGRLLVLRPGNRISILALSNARLLLLGGEP